MGERDNTFRKPLKYFPKKHILSLTYKPKIPKVLNGELTQTVRPYNLSKPKNKGDLIMFHGWTEKPYQSKWSFRTPYWTIISSFPIHFIGNGKLRKADKQDYFHDVSNTSKNHIAVLDGFSDFNAMETWFLETYDKKLYEMIFEVIRWHYD